MFLHDSLADNCQIIDTFKDTPGNISFDNDGNGVTLDDQGVLKYFKNDKEIGRIHSSAISSQSHSINTPIFELSYTKNGVYVTSECEVYKFPLIFPKNVVGSGLPFWGSMNKLKPLSSNTYLAGSKIGN